jgi:hypothetical protein
MLYVEIAAFLISYSSLIVVILFNMIVVPAYEVWTQTPDMTQTLTPIII